MKIIRFIDCLFFSLVFLLVLVGCASNVSSIKTPTMPITTLPAPPPQPSTAINTLSYGMVTAKIQKNLTNQTEIIEMFGGPNTLTTDRDGTEVWMYDKTASVTSGNSQQSATQADALSWFLPEKQSAQVSQSQMQGASNVVHSVKSMTLIIKFNSNKTVKDYAVRQSSY